MRIQQSGRFTTLMAMSPILFMTAGCYVLAEALDNNPIIVRGLDIPDVIVVSNVERYSTDLPTHRTPLYEAAGEWSIFEVELSNNHSEAVFTLEYGLLSGRHRFSGLEASFGPTWDCSVGGTTTFHSEVVW